MISTIKFNEKPISEELFETFISTLETSIYKGDYPKKEDFPEELSPTLSLYEELLLVRFERLDPEEVISQIYESGITLSQLQELLKNINAIFAFEESLFTVESYTQIFSMWFDDKKTMSQISRELHCSHSYIVLLVRLGALYNGYVFTHEKKFKIESNDEVLNKAIATVFQKDLIQGKETAIELVSLVKSQINPRLYYLPNASTIRMNKFYPVIRTELNRKKEKSSPKNFIIKDVRYALERLNTSSLTMTEYDEFYSKRKFKSADGSRKVLKATSIIRHISWSDAIYIALNGIENFRINEQTLQEMISHIDVDTANFNCQMKNKDMEKALKLMSLLDPTFSLSPQFMQLKLSKLAHELNNMKID